MLKTSELAAHVQQAASRVRWLIMDVDGVLTDGQIFYGANGELTKAFNVRDGFGLRSLKQAGFQLAVISGRDSPAAAARLRELDITQVYFGVQDKLACFRQMQQMHKISAKEVAYIGDDEPDVPVIKVAGLGIAVANASLNAKQAAQYVTIAPGGRGAVREVCDLLLIAQSFELSPVRL